MLFNEWEFRGMGIRHYKLVNFQITKMLPINDQLTQSPIAGGQYNLADLILDDDDPLTTFSNGRW